MPSDPDDDGFLREVRAFLSAALPPDIADAPRTMQLIDHEVQQRWHHILAGRGWSVPDWPERFGGAGWSPRQMAIFEEEQAAAGAPPLSVFIGMIGPVLQRFGTPEQQARHLPPLVAGTASWCQGYSEPGAGSDLAGLRTRAVLDGGHYVVNGQKIWTTYAHRADWMFCLVRTSTEGRPQQGITFLLVDMTTPGIVIRPIRSIDGLHHLNEIFFTDVRVPVSERIGEEGQGWAIAKYLLEHERGGLGSLLSVRSQIEAVRVLIDEVLDRDTADGLAESATLHRDAARAEIEMLALEAYAEHQGALGGDSRAEPSSASILKLGTTELQQRIGALGVRALGPAALPDQSSLLEPHRPDAMIGPVGAAKAMLLYLFGRSFTILGGTSEVQRGLIFRSLINGTLER
ncbi:acyl-CoA dehydrogenase family protein [uncultured Sphingomonas sp.]|uniref:acyl-CoA dehydrogenase family protein n=1 Tax=uncultured Sphingomonas sp. TaxID=158754 RepID=UPI0035CC8DED